MKEREKKVIVCMWKNYLEVFKETSDYCRSSGDLKVVPPGRKSSYFLYSSVWWKKMPRKFQEIKDIIRLFSHNNYNRESQMQIGRREGGVWKGTLDNTNMQNVTLTLLVQPGG